MKQLIAGVDIGGTMTKYVLCDAKRSVLVADEVETDVQDPAASLRRLATRLEEEAGRLGASLGSIGLACAGLVSPDTGHLGRSPNLPGWEDTDLAGLVRAACGDLRIDLANDVNAAVVGEWRLGAGRGCNDVVMIALGTGVGGGIVSGGRLLCGATNAAAEIGHATLDFDGPLCTCGGYGCLEAYAGAVALLKRAREIAGVRGAEVTEAFRDLVAAEGDRLSPASLFTLANGGDATAIEVFARAGRRLGQAVASLIALLDPDVIIIGGGVARAGDLILAPCIEVARRVVRINPREVPIVPARLGPGAAALGAACLSWGEDPAP